MYRMVHIGIFAQILFVTEQVEVSEECSKSHRSHFHFAILCIASVCKQSIEQFEHGAANIDAFSSAQNLENIQVGSTLDRPQIAWLYTQEK